MFRFATAKLLILGALIVGGVAGAHVSWLFAGTPVPAPKPKPAARRVAAPARPAAQPAASPAPPPADQAFVVRRVLDVPQPFRHGDWAWDESGAPPGPIVITVDLEAEVLSVFRDGYEIGAAVIGYGTSDKPSPLGVFPILEKDADHVSSLYDAPMPHMLRLTRDGVAIHGSKVAWDKATHGCIGVPDAFAAKLFAQAKVGDRVIITRGKRLDIGQSIVG